MQPLTDSIPLDGPPSTTPRPRGAVQTHRERAAAADAAAELREAKRYRQAKRDRLSKLLARRKRLNSKIERVSRELLKRDELVKRATRKALAAQRIADDTAPGSCERCGERFFDYKAFDSHVCKGAP